MEAIKKLKEQYEKHKTIVWTIAIGTAAAGGAVALAEHEANKEQQQRAQQARRNPPPQIPRPRTAGSWDSPYVRHASVDIKALGDPGNIIQDVVTGTIYASQNQAARELGVSKTAVFNHLHGKTSQVAGHKLTVVGKAPPQTES
jgi:hypothetical protein